MHRIFDKTDKGRDEIATRKHRLAPRLRTLLLLIDGKQSTVQVLQKIAGLDDKSIFELLEGDFIKEVSDDAADQSNTPAQPATPVYTLAEGETKFQAIHKFYCETIRIMIGLRGYNLQLKVDEAKTVDDLRALQEPYIAAVFKAKGDDIARDLHQRLDQLLNLDEAPPPTA